MASSVGGAVLAIAETIGGAVTLLFRILRALFPPRYDAEGVWRSFYNVGVKSYPIVVMTALFVGAIMVIQTAFYVKKTGATGIIGYGVGFSVFAEIGPILIGLMFSGRVGANNTAELGTMVVTEQVDALRALAIDPLPYLVVPRFLAMLGMLTLLMVLGDLFAIVGAALTAQLLVGFHWRVLVADLLQSRLLDEFTMGLVKAACFGISISCISCYFGLAVRGGATGVGRAVNNSVVSNATAIFVIDFVVGYLYSL
ncbi:MAG: ABC transporter permease [Deltaproteobacteria bacterium]|nr:ABC transporter permease [Deltaproteobacteria bacterium]MCB9788755.1 ABC transporter permease [Deltaproteobacteria bacterium]